MVCRGTSNLASERLGSSAGRCVGGQAAEDARASAVPDPCERFSSSVGTFEGRYKLDTLALPGTERKAFDYCWLQEVVNPEQL